MGETSSPVSVPAGVGFAVTLLVADLSFDADDADTAKTSLLLASVIAAAHPALILRRRNRKWKAQGKAEI